MSLSQSSAPPTVEVNVYMAFCSLTSGTVHFHCDDCQNAVIILAASLYPRSFGLVHCNTKSFARRKISP